ncbi:tRNA epoxyqueuosine(34) reductase QueG [Bacillus benzoevorans]|uniref:Epoxyqueuosine reductase n=1 Tax=Bacillus benzoevorans TaxID=1456 RepID=A0A7X0HMA2_9BACI|nr:tRNA epoxyqueuosine(34) reductase QueG [Bacillus benzoevorans]MBB6443422.1 epoxyqueuosine reductase [Bacillus benzoevorans]
MNIAQLKQEIIQYSKTIGVDKIGFTTAAPFAELRNRLIKQRELNYQSGFEEDDIEKRVNPRLLLDGAESIISIAVAYPSKMTERVSSKKGERRGIFSRASWGLDYHMVLRERLRKLETFMAEKVPDAQFRSMVDTGELVDRAVAERAGIGWSGKNCSIITPEFGSYVYIGEMITNIPFAPDAPIEDRCGDCRKCLDACPTGALVQGGQINASCCISFLTQTKELIPEEFRDKIGNRLYGCDSCQTACPENKGMDFHLHPEVEPEPEIVKPLLKPLLNLSNRQFKEQFGTLSGSWRGKNPIQRNAVMALAHFKDKEDIETILNVLQNDTRPVLRGTAAWAIRKIAGKEAIRLLEAALEKEMDDSVRKEIINALKR